jgi:hypothetical protein
LSALLTKPVRLGLPVIADWACHKLSDNELSHRTAGKHTGGRTWRQVFTDERR